MPIYEYECSACRGRFEALVSYADRDEVACETCDAPKVARLVSAFATSGIERDGGITPGGTCCGAGGCGHCGH